MTLAEIFGTPAKPRRCSASKGRAPNSLAASPALRHWSRDYDNTGAVGNFALVTSSGGSIKQIRLASSGEREKVRKHRRDSKSFTH